MGYERGISSGQNVFQLYDRRISTYFWCNFYVKFLQYIWIRNELIYLFNLEIAVLQLMIVRKRYIGRLFVKSSSLGTISTRCM